MPITFAAFVKNQGPCLNRRELCAVTALLAHVADAQKISCETASAILSATFGVAAVRDIASDRYDDVIRFLVDTRLSSTIN